MKQEIISMLKISWHIMAIILAMVIIIRVAYYKNHKKKVSILNEVMLLLFVAYILILFQLVTYESNGFNGGNFIPFREILRYDWGTKEFTRQVIGNIILFIPFGFFITYYANIKNIGSAFFTTVAASIVIETVQYFIGRSFDIDDIILNVIGGLLGFLLFVALDAVKKHLPSLFQKDIIYVILSILLIIFILLNIFGVINF
jgi:glycopeptide antibiotics resistance protein